VLNHLFPTGCGYAGGAHRLTIARGSPTYLSAVVPGARMLAVQAPGQHRRRRPYIFLRHEICGR
jgi:hypothetical protein